MNLSKIIKDSKAFVPQRIIVQEDQPPLWSDLAKPVKEAQQIRKTQVVSKKNLANSTRQHTPDSFAESHQFDSDFSAPEHDIDTIKPNVSDNASTLAAQPDPVDIETIKEESFNKGLQAGLERAESDYGSSTRALQSVFEQLNSIREIILSNSLVEMQELVLQIAKKIIRHSVTEQPHTVLKTVEEAIQKAVKSDEFVISINPDDYNTIKDRSKDFVNSISGLENIILKADATIEQGGCLIESSNCTVDATITSQLGLITNEIKSKTP